MSETKSRRGWDDRRGSSDQYERKRKFEDDYHGQNRSRDEGRSRQHRSNENKRYRGFDDEDRHRDHEENRHREGDERQHRGNDDRQQYNRSREYDDKPRRNNREKKSRFEQVFVKKEASPEWGKATVKDEVKVKIEKEKPNFQTSGKLTEDTNTVHGVVIKYSEPTDARKPKRRWRLYPFKGEKALPVLYIHRQSAYLMGRDRKIADIPLDHPSCSKQHAALQYRLSSYKKENGAEGKHIRPYLIDLESANGTFVNDVRLEPRRYHELLERDVIKFGFSSREYVVLHEQSKDEAQDDDVNET